MSEEEYTCKSVREMSTSRTSDDGLPAADTMESFLEILHGLGKDNSEDSNENLQNAHSDVFPEDNLYNEVNIRDHGEDLENVAFQEYLSSKSKIEKTAFAHAAGRSSADLHTKQILLPTSVKRVSVPSVLVQPTSEKSPSKSASILHASEAFSKMQPSRFFQASRISKGSTILRSTGSTWMTKAPKFAEKSFPKYTHYVIDTSIMNLKPDLVDFEIPTDKEFEKLIKSAFPKANYNANRPELNADVKQFVNDSIGSEHSSKHKPPADKNTDADKSMWQLLHRPRALTDYRSACHNVSGIELATTKLFRYLSKPHYYEFQMNKMLQAKSRIKEQEIPVDISVAMSRDCTMLAEGNILDRASIEKTATSDEYHIAEDCKELEEPTAIDLSFVENTDGKNSQKRKENKTENTEIFGNIVGFQNGNGCNIKDDVFETGVTEVPKHNGNHDSNEGFIAQRNTMEFRKSLDAKAKEKCSEDTLAGDKMSTLNTTEAEMISAAILHDISIGKDMHRMTDSTKIYQLDDRCADFKNVFDLRSFFKVCGIYEEKIKKYDTDDAFDLRTIFRSRTDENGASDEFDLDSFFRLCDKMNKMDDDHVFDLASFFQLCDKVNDDPVFDIASFFRLCGKKNEMDDDHVFDLALFFRLCTRNGDEINNRNTDDVFDLGSFFQLCSRNDKKMDESDADDVCDLRFLFEPYKHDEGMSVSDLSGVFESNINEVNANDKMRNEIQNPGNENYLQVIEEVLEDSVDVIDAFLVDSHINIEEEEVTIEVEHLAESEATVVDENSYFGEDSLFGILGVFCRSGLHSWDGCSFDGRITETQHILEIICNDRIM